MAECADCRSWVAKNPGHGLCRRYPPAVNTEVRLSENMSVARMLEVATPPTHWCGEHATHTPPQEKQQSESA